MKRLIIIILLVCLSSQYILTEETEDYENFYSDLFELHLKNFQNCDNYIMRGNLTLLNSAIDLYFDKFKGIIINIESINGTVSIFTIKESDIEHTLADNLLIENDIKHGDCNNKSTCNQIILIIYDEPLTSFIINPSNILTVYIYTIQFMC